MGWEVYGEFQVERDDWLVDKSRLSAFYNTNLELILRGLGAETIIFAGVLTNRCVAATSRSTVTHATVEAAAARKVGYGLDPEIEMSSMIRPESRSRIEQAIPAGVTEGARLLVDGRNANITNYERGYFLRLTFLEGIDPRGQIASTEIFGAVLGLMHVADVDKAVAVVNSGSYGNMACLFTRSGKAARQFRYAAATGNIGINVGVAAPMAFFPFSGWKESFFGDLHAQGHDAFAFYTESKVVIEHSPASRNGDYYPAGRKSTSPFLSALLQDASAAG